jgi:hypothetical protein
LFPSGLNLGLPLFFDGQQLCLPSRFALFCKSGLLGLTGGDACGFFVGLTAQALLLSAARFCLFHSAACLVFLPTGLFFSTKKVSVARPVTELVGLDAPALPLNDGQLPVKFGAGCGEVGASRPRTEAVGDEPLTEIDTAVATKHEAENPKRERATKHARERHAEDGHGGATAWSVMTVSVQGGGEAFTSTNHQPGPWTCTLSV